MNFKRENSIERNFYKQDFTPVNELLKRIRKCLISDDLLEIKDLNLENIIEFTPFKTVIYIYLFQEGLKNIRWSCRKDTLLSTLRRNIEALKQNANFKVFDIKNENKCRILLEYAIDRTPVDFKKITTAHFNNNPRFEIGIHGLEIKKGNDVFYYMPQMAVIRSHLYFKDALNYLISKTPIAKITKDKKERLEIFSKDKDFKTYIFRSRAFVTYKNTCIPLYRGNQLFEKFSISKLKEIITNTTNHMVEYQEENGKYLYYYDCKNDSRIDHEHPSRKEPDLYYNEIRHIGAIIATLRVWENFKKDKKYIDSAHNALKWVLTITKEQETAYGKAYYTFLNKKCKLGSVGLALAAFVYYRKLTNDKTYDEYIKGFCRHIITRIDERGDFLQYYIHPKVQNGAPLLTMTEDERKETFQFYYSGEALLGLAWFVKYFDNKELIKIVKEKASLALDFMVNIRPYEYASEFTSLPSDAWFMQATKDWCEIDEMKKENCINFVFNDAKTMMEKMYQKNDSPYLDYEGGFYYNYGDHYFPDGARSEGLIAAYYLAKSEKYDKLAKSILEACKIAAKNQYQLYNSKEFCYSHKNPDKSYRTVRLKTTRQWTRIDMAWHVSMFFMNLYTALKNK